MSIINSKAVVSIFPETLSVALPNASETESGVVAVGKNLQVIDGKLTVKDVVVQEDLELFGKKQLLVDLGSEDFIELASENTNIGLTGILPVLHGGTGATTASGSREALNIYSKAQTDTQIASAVSLVKSDVTQTVDNMLEGSQDYIEQLVINANAGLVNYITEVELLAFKPTVLPYTAKALDTKKVWAWSGSVWIDTGLSELDLAKTFMFSGKPYPLKQLTRGGGMSAMHENFAKFILDVKVVNPQLNKYYKLEIYMNGSSQTGNSPDGWGIAEYDKDAFAESTINTRKLVVTPSTAQTAIDRTGVGIIVLNSTEVEGLKFIIKYDGTALPTYGAFLLRSSTESDKGYSWIIDPICYETFSAEFKNQLVTLNTNTVNKSKTYPQKAMSRGGIISNKSSILDDLILNIKVSGAETGKVYKIEWIGNGTTTLGKPNGWRIASYNSDTFETSTINDRTLVVDYTVNQQELIRSGINKITIQSTTVAGLQFDITYDGSALPTSGTYIRTSGVSDNAYSWIIDPLCYEKTEVVSASNSLNTISYNATTKETFIDFKSGQLWYRWVFGVNGFNDLPNFKSIYKSVDAKTWTLINSTSSDWLPPLRIQAVNNGDGRSKFATGGNHGNISNTASGEKTARNVLFQVFADGSLLTTNTESQVSTVDIVVVNEVMAWNTTPSETSTGRYVLRQCFNLSFKGGSVEVTANNTALEDCNLARDSALQMSCTNLMNQMCFYGKSLKQSYVTETTSGKKSDYPNVIAAGAFSADTQLIMWMDHNYKKGDMSWLQTDSPLVRFSGSKCYMAVALDVDENQTDKKYTVPLLLGESYQYRGGYSLQSIQTNTNIDSSFIKHEQGKSKSVILTTNNEVVIV